MSKSIYLFKRTTTSCDYHRMILPFSRLRDLTYVDDLTSADVFICNRVPDIPIEDIKSFIDQGGKFILDLDDLIDLPKTHYLYPHWAKSNYKETTEELVKLAHVLWVSTENLYNNYYHLNNNIVVIPNGLPFDEGQFKVNNLDKVNKVIYTGGPSHYEDLKIIEGTPNIVLANAHNSEEFDKMRKLFPKPGFIKTLGLHEYMKVYDQFPVTVAPIVNSRFNSCKSNLKILEAGCKRIPIITSPYPPYDNPNDSKYITHANNKLHFNVAINHLLKNPSQAAYEGNLLGNYVREAYHIDKFNEIRVQSINSL